MRAHFVPLVVVLTLLGSAWGNALWAQEGASGAAAADADVQKLLQTLSFVSRRNEQDYKITAPRGIDEAQYVPIGGIDQFISIRGENRNNPVILFLHGGPGDATNPWGYLAFRSWLEYFTVVQWDQRGAGRTRALSSCFPRPQSRTQKPWAGNSRFPYSSSRGQRISPPRRVSPGRSSPRYGRRTKSLSRSRTGGTSRCS